MESKVFEKDYSYIYDLIYKEKKYKQEIEKIIDFLKQYHINKKTQFIDVGCGTGNHLIELLRLGYNVVGVDRSSEMLKIAEDKIKGFKKNKEILLNEDIGKIEINKKFDVMLCLFNVIGYIQNIDIALQSFTNLLKKEAFLVFDFWYGPAVKKNKPKKTICNIEENNLIIKKISNGKIIEDDKVEVTINFSLKKNNKLVFENKETHFVKFFFPEKLEKLLHNKGFEIIKITNFYDSFSKPDNDDWKAVCYAKKRE